MRTLWQKSRRWTVLTALLRERAVVGTLLALGLGYLVLSFFEMSPVRCLWRLLTRTRCPGCGLTTGCKAILRGCWMEGARWNWLSPLVILGLILFLVVFAMPKKARGKLLNVLAVIEGRLRIVLWVALLAIAQVVARIFGWA